MPLRMNFPIILMSDRFQKVCAFEQALSEDRSIIGNTLGTIVTNFELDLPDKESCGLKYVPLQELPRPQRRESIRESIET